MNNSSNSSNNSNGSNGSNSEENNNKEKETRAAISKSPSLLLCERVWTTIGSVNAVAMLDHGRLVSAYIRPGFTPPSEEKVMQMLFQVELVQSMANTHSNIFGPLDNIAIEYKERKVWVFKTKYGTLTFTTFGRLPHEQVLEQVRKILEDF